MNPTCTMGSITNPWLLWIPPQQIQLAKDRYPTCPMANFPACTHQIHTITVQIPHYVYTQMAATARQISCEKPIHRPTLPIMLQWKRNGTTLFGMSPPGTAAGMEGPTPKYIEVFLQELHMQCTLQLNQVWAIPRTVGPTHLQSNHSTNYPTDDSRSGTDGMARNLQWQVFTSMDWNVY